MAEETDQEAEARRQLEEFQRQQAALAASKNQPNAIPSEGQQPTPPSGFTARGLTPTDQPPPEPPTPQQQQALGIGNYIDQSGQSLGATHDVNGAPIPSPNGAVGIQGVLSPEEEQFWAANPLGAVKDPTTGNLIGLGDRPETQAATMAQYPQRMVQVNEGVGPPAIPYSEQNRTYTGIGAPPPIQQQQQGVQPLVARSFSENDFINPAIQNRLDQVRSELAQSTELMRGLSTQRPRGGISPFEAELARHRNLQMAERTLANELHQRAQIGLATALANTRQEQAIQHANTGTDMLSWASSIDSSKYPLGSPERNALIGQKYSQNASWLLAQEHNPELAQSMHSLLYGSPTVQNQIAALQPYVAEGQTTQVTGMGPRGATVKIVPQGNVPTNVQSRYAKLQAQAQYHQEAAAQQRELDTKALIANNPYKGAAGLHATQTEMRNLEQRFPGLKPPQSQGAANATPTATPQTTGQNTGYEVGVQYGNLRYKGGDPNLRTSWDVVQ